MQNRLLIILLTLLACISQSAVADTQEPWVNVSTASDFFYWVGQNDNVRLSNDIDLSGYTQFAGSKDFTFTHKIDGQGYALKNYSNTNQNNDYVYALFYNAKGATFKNLVIDNFYITQGDKDVANKAFLVLKSESCNFENVMMRNSKLPTSDFSKYVGFFVSESTNDTFTSCVIESSCSLQAKTNSWGSDTNAGGFAGQATGSTFSYCSNAGTIWADDNNEGGIVGHAYDCNINHCLNTGHITGEDYVGGIVGSAENKSSSKTMSITYCVNTGILDTNDGSNKEYHGGVFGRIQGDHYKCDQLCNFGLMNNCGDNCGSIHGCNSTVTNAHWYHYLNDILRSCSSGNEAVSGELAETTDWLYQSFDNDGYQTTLPVPLSVAGAVHKNYICDNNTLKYSNVYQAASGHQTQKDKFGVCTVCGRVCESPSRIHIKTAEELETFAKYVNEGKDFSNDTVYLDYDIDMEGITDFKSIGVSEYRKYKGTFDGQHHRITNLVINNVTDSHGLHETNPSGLFGSISGSNTVIKNVIMDNSCSITACAEGVAGIVGCVSSSSGSECNVTIQNCGNEAAITGTSNAAGILGGVYYNDNTQLTILNCYNAGTINGTKESAALCGWTNKNCKISNCFNSGLLTGVDGTNYFYRHSSSGTQEVGYCYDVNGSQSPGVTQTTAELLASGAICDKLNAYINTLSETERSDYCSWSQTKGVGAIPHLDPDVSDANDYLTITALENTDINFAAQGSLSPIPGLYYKKNSDKWTVYNLGTTLSLTANDIVKFRAAGENSALSTSDEVGTRFTSTGKVASSGNIMSLLDIYCKQTSAPAYAFSGLFAGCTTLTTAPQLPAQSLGEACYLAMFKGCTNLTTAPALPATKLATRCYYSMFQDCTALTESPQLPATILPSRCYQNMFYGCTSLCRVTTYFSLWWNNATIDWLNNVASNGVFLNSELTESCNRGTSTVPNGWSIASKEGLCFTAQEATELAFSVNGSVTEVPSLIYSKNNGEWQDYTMGSTLSLFGNDNVRFLAKDKNTTFSQGDDATIHFTSTGKVAASGNIMTLIDVTGSPSAMPAHAFTGLFADCSTLTTAPTIPSITPSEGCYKEMFKGCSSLKSLKVKFTDWNYFSNATKDWLSGVSEEGTFDCTPELNSVTGRAIKYILRSTSTVPSGWKIFNNDYLCFTAQENYVTIKFSKAESSIAWRATPTLEYSTDRENWTSYEFGTGIYLGYNGCKVWFRCPNTNSSFSISVNTYINFSANGKVAASGNIMSLMDKNYETTDLPEYAFNQLFQNCTNLVKAPRISADFLGQYSCQNMYNGCSNLTEASEISATKVGYKCCAYMFKGCSNLTKAPELFAKSLESSNCFIQMFEYCNSLSSIKVHFTDWGAENSYNTMGWLDNVSRNGTFYHYDGLTIPSRGGTYVPWYWDFVCLNPSVTLNSYGLATYSAPVDLTIATEGVSAYTATIDGDVINLKKLEGYIPAGTGVFLYGKNMANTKVTFTETTANATETIVEYNDLQPTTTATESLVSVPDGTKWVLSGGSFVQYTGTTFKANRAYLIHELSGGSSAKMSFSFDDDTVTEIEELRNLETKELRTSGKYLEDGRLVIMKNGRRYSAAGQLVK